MIPPRPIDPVVKPSPIGPVVPVDPIVLRPGPLDRPDRPEPDPTWRTRRDRLTPFLVLRTGPTDMGQVAQRRIAMNSPTLRLIRSDTSKPSGFELQHGVHYRVTAEVTNLGQGSALMGIATLRIMHGTELTAFWGKPDPKFFDMVDFRAPRGGVARLRFRREWVAPTPGPGLDDRVSVILHVVDLMGDNSDFVVGDTGDRHVIRQDYHLT